MRAIRIVQNHLGQYQPDCRATAADLCTCGLAVPPRGFTAEALPDMASVVEKYGFELRAIHGAEIRYRRVESAATQEPPSKARAVTAAH